MGHNVRMAIRLDYNLYSSSLLLAGFVSLAAAMASNCSEPPIDAAPKVASGLENTAKLVDFLIQDSKRHEVIRPSDPASPLRIAEEYAAWIAGDVSEYADVMVTIIQRHIQVDQKVDAIYLTERLPGSGRLQAHALLARYFAEKGKKEESIAQQKEAELRITEGSDQTQQKVLINLMVAARLSGNVELIETNKKLMSDITALEVDLICLQLGNEKTPSKPDAVKRLSQINSKGVDELKARYMLEVSSALFINGNVQDAEACFDEAGQHATARGLAHEYRVLLDLARLAKKHQQKERAEKSMTLYLKACDRFVKTAEWRASYLCAAAETLIDWGRREEAEKWFKSARDGASEVYVIDAMKAHLDTVALVGKIQSKEAADTVVLEALKAGLSHPHRRAKGRAAVLTCLHYNDCGRQIPAPVLKLLRATSADSVESPNANDKPTE